MVDMLGLVQSELSGVNKSVWVKFTREENSLWRSTCLKGAPISVDQISDAALLRMIWGH